MSQDTVQRNAASSEASNMLINIVRQGTRGYGHGFELEISNTEPLSSVVKRMRNLVGAGRLTKLFKMLVLFQEETIFDAHVKTVSANAGKDDRPLTRHRDRSSPGRKQLLVRR